MMDIRTIARIMGGEVIGRARLTFLGRTIPAKIARSASGSVLTDA